MNWPNLLLPLLVIFGVSIFSWVSRSDDVGFDWGKEAVTITDPAGDSFTILYADVISMTLEDCPGYGVCVSGENQNRWVYGTWENDVWGVYRLVATPDVVRCIVFQTAQTYYVLSYESDKTTEALYEQLVPIVEAAQ